MKKIFWKSILLSALFATGCAKEPQYIPSVNTISNAETSARIKYVADKRIDTDPILSQQLCMTEIRESKTNDGYTRIQVFLKNMSGGTYWIIYRFNWYDDQGVEVENPDDGGWTRQLIAAGDDVTLTSVAPGKVCRDFKLRLKAAE